MQDVQNIPNPDVNSTEHDNDFGNHSDIENEMPDSDVEQPNNLPLPPDQAHNAPVEEPPETEKPPIGENRQQPKEIV